MSMLPIRYTAYIMKLEKNKQVASAAERFRAVRTYAQFQMLSDLMGYGENFPKDVFMLVFSNGCADAWEDGQGGTLFFDVIYEVLQNSTMLNKIVTTKTFINLAGRWIATNYTAPDKTMFLKLTKIMGHIANRLMGL